MRSNKNKTLRILGGYDAARFALADWRDRDVHTWWLNTMHEMLDERHLMWIDRWFEMHTFRRMMRRYQDNHIAWLKQKHDFPIMMRRHYDEVPNCVTYPFREVAKLAPGVALKTLFGCTHSYMMGLAIKMGYGRIELWSVNLANPVETFLEKPSFAFWYGQAIARRIEVDTSQFPYLMPDVLYGFQERRAPWWIPREVRLYTMNVELYGNLAPVYPNNGKEKASEVSRLPKVADE